MPNKPPPPGGLAAPAHVRVLEAGTVVWRIHSAGREAHKMNPTPQPSVDEGGRFDSLDGAYPYLYLGDSPEAAIAETLCRNLPLDGRSRMVPAAALRGRQLTSMTVLADIAVAALHGPHLAAIGQDLWLTKCDAEDYLQTRAWAAAILAATPDLGGLAYRCRHDEDRTAWMLTTDAATATHPLLAVLPDSVVKIDGVPGRDLVAAVLDAHSAVLSTGH